jgi:Xaa-Pro dipeptidase
MRRASDFPRFSADEMAARHRRVEALMDQERVDALLVFGAGRFATDIYWLTEWPGGMEAYALFQPDAEPVLLAQLYNHLPMARLLSVVSDVRWGGASTAETVAALLEERGLKGKRLGLVGNIDWRHYGRIARAVGEDGVKDLSGAFRRMRLVRSPEEIERLSFASELTDRSMQAIADGLAVGMKESEIAALIEPAYLKAGGYAGIHFMTAMPMRAPHFPVPAQYQSDRRLEPGDCLVTEISGAWWGYSGQIHRTYSLGEGPTPEWAAMHEAAVEVFEALVELIKEGVSTREVEEAADLAHARGYWLLDDLLHGVSQTPPIIQSARTKRHANPDLVFQEGMAITIQPNLITPDERMGLQFGETFVVRKDGLERLNHFPREWITCGA